jgi:hypothetical protein
MTTNKPKTFAACDLSTGRSEGEAMTDRELLELAAKAAGINIFDWTPGGQPTANGSWDGIWNPLAYDGDALRLAVALGIDIVWCSSGRVIAIASVGDVAIEVVESSPEDREENTRRAITRAAAEIGRSMP